MKLGPKFLFWDVLIYIVSLLTELSQLNRIINQPIRDNGELQHGAAALRSMRFLDQNDLDHFNSFFVPPVSCRCTPVCLQLLSSVTARYIEYRYR